MARFAGIAEAVVVARAGPGDDPRLAGYFTATGPIDERALRAHLRAALPEAMIPADLVALDAMPLTANRKIDRKALPEPRARARTAAPVAPAAGVSEAEHRIAAIWTAVLGVGHIEPGDSFFDLGGHSLLAVQAHRALREAFATPKLAITDIFRFPVLRDLARHLEALGGATSATPAPAGGDERAKSRAETMSKRRAMRAGREQQPS